MNDPGKKGVSVKISRDDGETFREAFVIEDGDDEDESSGGATLSSVESPHFVSSAPPSVLVIFVAPGRAGKNF